MGVADDNAVEVRAQGWRTLAALHGLIERRSRTRAKRYELSVVEFTVLDALSRQDGWHMRMEQLARAAALSSSAATRLVTRLEDRGLLRRTVCPDDRRGIYSELTPKGSRLLARARPPTTRRSTRRSKTRASRPNWPIWCTRSTALFATGRKS